MSQANNDFSQLLDKQRAYFKSNATRPVAFRIEQLTKLKSLLKANQEQLIEAIDNDFGKSEYETQLSELFPLYHEIDTAVKKLKKWVKPTKVSTNLLNLPGKSYLYPEPLGTALVIGAWNFPYNLSLTPVVSSIAAGNTTILKPSELPSGTSQMMAKLINDNFDPEFLKVIEGGVPETTALLDLRFDKVFFTGSPKVGRIVNQAVAKHLCSVTLELGGKNPTIFAEDANLNVGVKRMIWAKFLNSGQLCIAPDYILVHKSIKQQFLERAKEEIEKHNFSFESGNYVQIIDERNFDRVAKLIDPDKVFFGGKHSREQRFIEPTLLHNVSLDDEIMQDEIFGPLLPVLEYENLDDAFEIIKGYDKPLAAYLYSNDKQTKQRFLNEIPFGGGGINESVMHNSNPNLPFGGVGTSGQGAYHGKHGFDCFSHHKAVLEKPTLYELNLKYYGYSDKKLNTIKKLLGV